ncbi:endonuclease/exonuclease/phosphatase family [Gloeomargarita lithophora Alchichica-D10]|uniref:Endonuclease/exonuclease/phosphatase family n=2 Tax=Gloeomargarita TaxID=1188227 RepID=A0A1J0AAR1_9CYAN|nr:endonuclease/exonuclease/phosphatase family [Gloeomargarita lithophora Alchichica-D10]
MKFLGITLLLAACSPGEPSSRLTVAAFNVESGSADPQVIAEKHIAPHRNQVDIWGFSEVESNDWMEKFRQAMRSGWGSDYRWLLGRSGGKDRLGIVYNARRLTYLRHEELEQINPKGSLRSPLVAEFRFRLTGQRFLFVVNHFYRGDEKNAGRRHQQAQLFNEWAQSQNLPIIAVGDYNFDWDIGSQGQKRDLGFDLLTQNEVFRWVQPQQLVSTQCNPEFNSVLDFIFVGGEAKNWPAASDILQPEPEYCSPANRKTHSDHRPIRAVFELVVGQP